MSEQDDADVIEQGPRQFGFLSIPGLPAVRGVIGTGRRRLVVIAAACALLVTAATLVTVRLTEGSPGPPGLAGLITEITTVPVGESIPGLPGSASSAGAYSSTLVFSSRALTAVSGPPLGHGGVPEVFYVGSEYCPYCAMENWPLIVALSRFGQFTSLATSRSPKFDGIAPVDSWTFYGSHYTSSYLAFVPVEEYSNVLVNLTASASTSKSYRRLQRLTPAQQAIFARYDKTGSTPFLDFGNRAVQIGSGPIPPQLMTGRSWPQLAAALRHPKTPLGAALLAEADSITAELCRLTGDRPAAACPAFLRNVKPSS